MKSTPFSDFIRNATPEQKESVYSAVMDSASVMQKALYLAQKRVDSYKDVTARVQAKIDAERNSQPIDTD